MNVWLHCRHHHQHLIQKAATLRPNNKPVYECTIRIRNCRTLLHMRRADAAYALTRSQHALICVKWRHGRYLESVTPNRKSDSVNRCVLTWRSILPNFVPIGTSRFFEECRCKKKKKNKNIKTRRDMESVSDPKIWQLWRMRFESCRCL